MGEFTPLLKRVRDQSSWGTMQQRREFPLVRAQGGGSKTRRRRKSKETLASFSSIKKPSALSRGPAKEERKRLFVKKPSHSNKHTSVQAPRGLPSQPKEEKGRSPTFFPHRGVDKKAVI